MTAIRRMRCKTLINTPTRGIAPRIIEGVEHEPIKGLANYLRTIGDRPIILSGPSPGLAVQHATGHRLNANSEAYFDELTETP